MANKDLFTQAIADAKKLKEISMANAKQAIEEAFAPRIQEMFRMKLSEMEEEPLEEDDYTEDGMEGGMEEGKENMDEMSLDEILAELELEEGMDDQDALEEAKKKKDAEEEAPADDEAGEDEMPADDKAGDESGDVAELSIEEFKNLVRDIVADVMGGQQPEASADGGADLEGGDESISLDEILAELQENQDMEEGLGSMLKKAGNKFGAMVAGADSKLYAQCKAEGKSINKMTTYDGEEMTEMEACLKEKGGKMGATAYKGAAGFTGELEEEEMEEGLGSMLKKASNKFGAMVAGADSKLYAQCKAEGKSINKMTTYDGEEMTEMEACLKEKGGKMGATAYKGAAGFTGKMEEAGQLQEAVKVIKALKSQLNEINLLNAKLLYVNKIFKAKSLSEAQKVKVITAFDRAATIKEAKNIYATLVESLQTTSTKKAPLKESLGFASKPIGNAPATPIVESDAYVYRMQQLAGLRQPNI